MRILVTGNHVPFVHGGGEYHLQNLTQQLTDRGHQVELMRVPFKFQPEANIHRAMAFCEGFDFTHSEGRKIDRVISLQFPAYGMSHPQHVVWIMHQHRAVYELYEQQVQTPELAALRDAVHAYDTRVLSQAWKRFANSGRVAQRLKHFNGLDAQPLYHPPPHAERFSTATAMDYIFAPSRLESLKRQDLLIEAARYMTSPLNIIIAGEGGQAQRYARLIAEHGLENRVRLVGRISEAEKLAYYAHAMAVFFAPFDEDYGYITLEAMLSAKPVLTCHDSGGPTELVVHGQTGWVCEPDAQQIAHQLDQAWQHRQQTRDMGMAAQAHYHAMNISWDGVVEQLLSD